ncbi:MAG TPA: NAD-binding protein, partial [Pirellulales bacterium]|nr:NAD-binding protein [Pirellulales bacterium]
VGISSAVYTLGGFWNMMAEGEVDRALGIYRSSRAIERLENHVIVCGYGRLGRVLAGELKAEHCRLVVIDSDGERVTLAAGEHLAYTGDATEEEVLQACGIERAQSLVTALPTDAANVFITLTSRNLNPKLQIIARGESTSSQKKLMQAGADRVVLPAITGAQRMAAMITRPSALEFVELVAGRAVMDVEIDEMTVSPQSPLIGRTVAQTEARRRHGLLIVAVRREHGGLVFNPDAEFAFAAADTVIVMGKPPLIAKFREEYAAK